MRFSSRDDTISNRIPTLYVHSLHSICMCTFVQTKTFDFLHNTGCARVKCQIWDPISGKFNSLWSPAYWQGSTTYLYYINIFFYENVSAKLSFFSCCTLWNYSVRINHDKCQSIAFCLACNAVNLVKFLWLIFYQLWGSMLWICAKFAQLFIIQNEEKITHRGERFSEHTAGY